MTRLSSATPNGKKHLPNTGKQRKQPMKTDDAWQRKHSMPAYCRPNHPRWDFADDADDMNDMNMDASHDA